MFVLLFSSSSAAVFELNRKLMQQLTIQGRHNNSLETYFNKRSNTCQLYVCFITFVEKVDPGEQKNIGE